MALRTHQQLSVNDEAACCRHSKQSNARNHENIGAECDSLSDSVHSFLPNALPGVQLGHSRHIHSDSQYLHINEYDDDHDGGDDNAYLEGRTTNGHQFKINEKSVNREYKKYQMNIVSLMQRAITVLNLFAASQLGHDPDTLLTKLKMNKCSDQKAGKANSAAVEKAKAQHWGTIRARLEVAINVVQEKVANLEAYRLTKTPSINLYPTHHTIPNIIWPNNASSETHQLSVPLGRESPDGKPSVPTRSNIVRPFASTRKGFSQDEVPGTQIALLVQNLHDASLRAMLHGGRPDRIFSDILLHSEKTELTSCTEENDDPSNGPYETEEFLHTEAERTVVLVVRRYFCPALRDLIEHGLIKKALSMIDENSPLGLVNKRSIFLLRPILNCLDLKSRNYSEDGFESLDLNEPSLNDELYTKYSSVSRSNHLGFHAWDVLMKFYQIKNGPRYNDSPARKLCESFDLDTVGGMVITNRQRFFSAMGNVLRGHLAYKRSKDAKFKAFVSIALNEHKLVPWLRMIFRNHAFVQCIYEPWSYTLSTGFVDVLTSLNKLTGLEFNLPYDYSIRHLKEIHDAF
ncbi:unnamed protein product [Heterobilharzia americana]|nr:unnamed protein product [Heterobilharzia americana]